MNLRRRPLQLSLHGREFKRQALSHGGEISLGRRKTRRPFDPKQALHVVLRSSRALGRHSLLHPAHCNAIHDLRMRLQKRWDISVYRYANVGNHLHLLIRAKTRKNWQGFIREFSGGVAVIVTGAKKGQGLPRSRSSELPESAKRGFWDHLVYTRIVRFGRDFKRAAEYVLTNLWEGRGIPFRKLLAKGYRILEVSADGAVLVPKAGGH